jgi:hypothetical protein
MANRRFFGGLILVLLIAGVGIPALFGFIQAKASEIGINDLLGVSTDSNSTYFINKQATHGDADETGNYYWLDVVLDEENNLDLVMADKINVGGTAGGSDFHFWVDLNKTNLDNVDLIKVIVKIFETGDMNITNTKVVVQLYAGTEIISEKTEELEGINETLSFEIPIDAVKRLKLDSADSASVHVWLLPRSGTNDFDNAVVGFRVELYDTKKVDSGLISNAMLAVSGFVMIIGAFAATPFWNPTRSEIFGRQYRIRRKK